MTQAIIIEDEDIAAIRLQKMIQELDESIQIVKILASVKEAVAYLSQKQPDLIFLDINLSDNNSFEIFNQIPEINSKIIFTTAYSEYAMKAFEQNSIDYLLKPISKEKLSRSLEKFKKWHEQSAPDYKKLFHQTDEFYKKRFLVKINQSLKTIEVDDIAYFFSEDKISFIRLKTGKKIPIDYTLKKLEEVLHPNDFFRINRQYIIHISSIKKMFYSSKSRIIIHLEPKADDQAIIVVAIEKLGKFKKWLSI